MRPPKSCPDRSWVNASVASTLYAVVTSACACIATASLACTVPFVTLPGGKPVIAVPGDTPRFPESIVGPVFVTVEPARAAKLLAVAKN